MRMFCGICVLLAALVPGQLGAQDPVNQEPTENEEAVENASPAEDGSTEAADREQLRDLRESLIEAVIAGDVDAQIQHVRPDVVTTWQNNHVARGHDGLRAFLEEMSEGNGDVFQGYTTRPASDEVIILPGGQTAVAYGSSVPRYKYLGMDFELQNRWTATLVKEEGEWNIAAYHVSGNIADNPLLTAAKKSLYWAGGGGVVVGLLIGFLAARLFSKPRQPAT